MFELVDLAIGSRGGIDRPPGTGLECLHLEFFGFKNDRCLAVGSDAVHAGWLARRHIDVTGAIGCNRPDIGGRRGIQALERGCQLEAANAANRHARSRALAEFVKFRLLPDARALGERHRNQPGIAQVCKKETSKKEEEKLSRTLQFHTSKHRL